MDVEDSASSESHYSGSEEPERPNRWTGAPSTWHALTAQERGLEASLVELRNRDLSIHLYNSFALKTSSRKYREVRDLKSSPSPSRESPVGDESDDQARDEIEERAGKGWAPPKVWTAWPMPPEQVPRRDEHVGPDDEDESCTFKRKEKERPSRELEDVLFGTALKFAKERWERREMAPVEEELDEGSSGGEDIGLESELPTEEVRGEGTEEMNDHSGAEGNPEPMVKELSQPPPEKTILQPVLSADDDRSRDLLRPSIRHTLSRLDDVLMALHHARQTCRRYATDSESSTDDELEDRDVLRDESASVKRPREDEIAPSGEVSGDESAPAKRPRGRSRKFENLTSRPKPAGEDDSQPTDVDLTRTKKTHLGRPKKQYEALEGETHDEYLVRIARLQKKPIPPFTASSRPTTPEQSPVKGRRGSFKRERLGTRDWSEVLGSAALVGFPQDVLARAARRCAELFGESMTMMELAEDPAEEKEDHFSTTFMPEKIPDLSYESRPSSEDNDEDDVKMKQRRTKILNQNLPGQHNSPCPIESCPRHIRGFNHLSDLQRHLLKAHKLTKEEASDILDGRAEMHGAVHVDGFLKPIKIPTGMRGGDKRQRSGGRWAKESILAGEGSSVEKVEEDDSSFSSGP